MKLLVLATIALTLLFITIVTATTDEEEFYYKWKNRQFDESKLLSPEVSSLFNKPLPPNSSLELGANQFLIENAKIFSRLSAAAYCAPPAIAQGKTGLEKWSCQACIDSGITLTNVSPFRIAASDLHGYVGFNAKANTIVLVFTGSQSIVNWMYNLDASFVDYDGVPGGTIHKGFYTIWKQARPTIIPMLDSLFYLHPTATLTLSGHSLGASIALIAAVDIGTASGYKIYNNNGVITVQSVNKNFFDDAVPTELLQSSKLVNTASINQKYILAKGGLYTFGEPRSFNNVLSNWIMNKFGQGFVFRITHNQDPVPHIPPLLLWPTAQHVTTEAFYVSGGLDVNQYVFCPNAPEDSKCSNQFALPMQISDHLDYLSYHVGAQPVNAC